jgi:hypothetical protein
MNSLIFSSSKIHCVVVLLHCFVWLLGQKSEVGARADYSSLETSSFVLSSVWWSHDATVGTAHHGIGVQWLRAGWRFSRVANTEIGVYRATVYTGHICRMRARGQ